jgi:hypothetical protein
MGKSLGDDLRRKLLFAYDQGEGTLQELASRFVVSVGWAKKISAARNRTGQETAYTPTCAPTSNRRTREGTRRLFCDEIDCQLSNGQASTIDLGQKAGEGKCKSNEGKIQIDPSFSGA